MIPSAVLDPQILAVANRECRKIAFVEKAFLAHERDQFGAGESEVLGGFFQATFHLGLLGCMRGGSRHGSQVVDGFGHLLVDLGIATAHGEALCAWTFHADAHDGGDAWTGLCAMDGNVDGKIETHVKA
ncbi:hypothetical protein D3C85_1453360 [compost metagenome]